MRWHILRVLLHKEALRHLANRGGLVLLLLLVAAALLLSFGGHGAGPAAGLTPGVRRCYVDYWQDGPFIDHLRANVPDELRDSVRFRPLSQVSADAGGRIVYPQNTGAIQIRNQGDPGLRVQFWQPGGDGSALAPYEAWFWKEALRYSQKEARAALAASGVAAPAAEAVEAEHATLKGGMDARSGLATALVLFGLFFVCVYLLPALACEERERGVLLAQALSPASPGEILAARFLFYPALGLGLALVLAACCEPRALGRPFFWAALLVAAAGAMGVGLTISSIARTQRAASMGAMCYLLVVALLLSVCQQANIPGLSYLALEYHCPRLLHAALTNNVLWYHYGNLAVAAVLAVLWTGAAVVLFRRQGWQ
jgi:hypothetical protein